MQTGKKNQGKDYNSTTKVTVKKESDKNGNDANGVKTKELFPFKYFELPDVLASLAGIIPPNDQKSNETNDLIVKISSVTYNLY